MPTIGLCMIARDEEENLRRCLKSAAGLADECVVVDTGSRDETSALCQAWGARVLPGEWTGDFAAARNLGLAQASCDWILLLDADEALACPDPGRVREALENTPFDALTVGMAHFYGRMPAHISRAHFSGGLRLVRNTCGLRFQGKVHERLDVSGLRVAPPSEAMPGLLIRHYGYMEDAAAKKADRNLALLLAEQAEGDPWRAYCLGAEYYRAGRLVEAYREVNIAIALSLQQGRKPASLAYKLKYDVLLTLGCFDVAFAAIDKAIALYPGYVDLHLYRGILRYQRGAYAEAAQAFSRCLILGETNASHLILSGAGSFLALYNLGMCHEKLGEFCQAKEAFRQAETLCPGLEASKALYKGLLVNTFR